MIKKICNTFVLFTSVNTVSVKSKRSLYVWFLILAINKHQKSAKELDYVTSAKKFCLVLSKTIYSIDGSVWYDVKFK